MDWFVNSVSEIEPLKISDQQHEGMTDCAEGFLRARGSISYQEWVTLTAVSRAAFVEAGNRIMTDQAQAVIQAALLALADLIPEEDTEDGVGSSDTLRGPQDEADSSELDGKRE